MPPRGRGSGKLRLELTPYRFVLRARGPRKGRRVADESLRLITPHAFLDARLRRFFVQLCALPAVVLRMVALRLRLWATRSRMGQTFDKPGWPASHSA